MNSFAISTVDMDSWVNTLVKPGQTVLLRTCALQFVTHTAVRLGRIAEGSLWGRDGVWIQRTDLGQMPGLDQGLEMLPAQSQGGWVPLQQAELTFKEF